MNDIKTAYLQGVQDRVNNKNINDNPFANQGDKYNYLDWIKGFNS